MATTICVITGKSGSGARNVAAQLAAKLGWRFLDADDLFPQHMRMKMQSGIPLTQEDRTDWLSALHTALLDWLWAGASGVLGCSYLDPKDWRVLSSSIPPEKIKLVRMTDGNFQRDFEWKESPALRADSGPKLSGSIAQISQITVHAKISEADVVRIAAELANRLSDRRENPTTVWISRESVFGYGCLLVGIPSSYLSDKLFGAIPALIVSSVCLVIGLLFLISVHIHDLETRFTRRRIVSIIATYSIIGAIVGALVGGLAGTIRQFSRKQAQAAAGPTASTPDKSSPLTK
jgi:hypothetical protein